MPKSRARKGAKRKGSGRPPRGPREEQPRSLDDIVRVAANSCGSVGNAGDPALAEAWASMALGMAYKLPIPWEVRTEFDREYAPRLVQRLALRADRHGLAGLRALAAVGDHTVAVLAQDAGDRLAGQGVNDPAWLGVIGSPSFLSARVMLDPWDDQRGYFATFQYPGQQPHTIMALYDRNLSGIVKDASVGPGAIDPSEATLTEGMEVAEADPTEMATVLLGAVAKGDMFLDNDWTEDFKATRALVVARMRLLPHHPVPAPAGPDQKADSRRINAFLRDSGQPDTEEARAIAGYALWFRGGDEVLRWSPIGVEQFLLDFLPRKVSLDMAEIRALPTVLRAWVRYCLTQRGVAEPWIVETEEAVDDCAAEFRRTVVDPENFGPAKAIAQALQVEGVDPTDKAALDKWMQDFNERPIEERDAFLGAMGYDLPPLGGAMHPPASATSTHFDHDSMPPDLPEFAWGSRPGPIEAEAQAATRAFLAGCVADGTLVPGGRAWKGRQEGLVRDFLGSWLAAIRSERIDAWLARHPPSTRRDWLEPLATRLAATPTLPDGTADPCPPLAWLLGQFAEGVPLTQKGNLGQKFVQSAAGRFGWDLAQPPRTESDLYDLHLLRSFVQKRLGFARRAGSEVVLTARGRSLLADPQGLWTAVARRLLPEGPFDLLAGELFLALLAGGDVVGQNTLDSNVLLAAIAAGFGEALTGAPPRLQDASWAVHKTQNLCRALGVLVATGDWGDRQIGLTGAGQAMAVAALHFLATGPS